MGGTGPGGLFPFSFPDDTDGILEFNNEFREHRLSGKVFSASDEKTRLELSGRYSDRTYHFPTDGSGTWWTETLSPSGKSGL